MEKKTIRCAIYTRKSTEEGLEKEFNSLEAQREAGESYIISQKFQGWEIIEKHYDDGGFSGGNMDRPALQELISDVKAGFVDMIVVYKIDRLTRSLLDFSKLIEILNEHNCSFVSVTQYFNTADSMGRLTLNILLSFAQFEREIASERIIDKIAAAKRKGMWVGGKIPFGYNLINKKLVINPSEAEIVKFIYAHYLKFKSVRQVAKLCNEQGFKPKYRGGKEKTFNLPIINSILSNIIYTGQVVYKGKSFPGQQEAIIKPEIFNEVQKIKEKNKTQVYTKHSSLKEGLLQRLVKCKCCNNALALTRTKKKARYYEYYVSTKAIKESYHVCQIGSIPRGELEKFVLDKVQNIFKAPEIIQELTYQVQRTKPKYTEQDIFKIVRSMNDVFQYFEPKTLRNILEKVIDHIIVDKNQITIGFKPYGISVLDSTIRVEQGTFDEKTLEYVYPVNFVKKRGRMTIIQPKNLNKTVDMKLIDAINKALKWQQLIVKEGMLFYEIAEKEKIDKSYVARITHLSTLAPDIIKAIYEGKQPPSLKISDFTHSPIPYLWSEQRQKYGFASVSSK